MTFTEQDTGYMRRALELARGQLGMVWPNPAVGCVLVRDGVVVAEGVTQHGGRPHGEQVALAAAGDDAKGATAYVSLEPCAHEGESPPCARLLAEAGVARVVYASFDPDPRVSGKGAQMLRDAGVEVESGLLQMEAEDLNEGFFRRVHQFRPMVTLKLATSQDGRINRGPGKDPWITKPAARMKGHEFRANHDAILVGVGTVLADDPDLTCRLEGLEDHSPVRIVLDKRLETPLDCKIVQSARDVPTWIVTGADEAACKPFIAAGVRIIHHKQFDHLDLSLRLIADEGITRLLVEGGAGISARFMEGNFVDHILWFQAPMIIGEEGLSVLDILNPDAEGVPAGFVMASSEEIGEDKLVNFRRSR